MEPTRFGTLRFWSALLLVIGAVTIVLTAIGVVIWAFEVDGVWATLGVIFLGAPLALALATWPIALSQLMRATADMGDAVSPGP
jgi:hypothetical protein